MFVRFLLVFDLLFIIFRIPCGHLLGKSCPLGFSLVLSLFNTVLVVRVSFSFGVCGRVWNSIVSVSGHCLFIYFGIIRIRIIIFVDFIDL